MVLIRIIVLKGLMDNVRVFAKHVEGVKNVYADSLSRNKIHVFHNLCSTAGKNMDTNWPVDKVWVK